MGVPLSTGGGAWGRGQCPLPRNFFLIFGLQIATFGALWGLFLRFPAAIAGLFHFRCDASLITEYRPYAATPLVLNCDFDPMCNITVLRNTV